MRYSAEATSESPMQPLVSIALTTYNGARYLPAQMASLLEQDYPNFEIVVSDDGSTDDTCALLAAYAAQDQRIRVLDVHGNVGFNANFARCFAACRGSLISPCDQDDVWHPHKTSRLVAALGDATLVYADSGFVDGAGQSLHGSMSGKVRMFSGSDPRPFLFCNSVSGHAMLFRRDLLATAQPFPATVYFDWWLAFVAANFGRIAYLDEVLVDYRRHDQAITCAPTQQDAAQRRLNILRIQTLRITTMAAYPGPFQNFIRELQRNWWDWYRSLFSWAMFRFMLKHADALLKIMPADKASWLRVSKYLLGHRLKRVLLPGRYLPLDTATLTKISAGLPQR